MSSLYVHFTLEKKSMNNFIPDSLKQNTSNACVTGARHVTTPVWFLPQWESGLMRGTIATFSSTHPYLDKTQHGTRLFFIPLRWMKRCCASVLWSYLQVSKPLEWASSTCDLEAMVTPREEQSVRASVAAKAYWGWWRWSKLLTWNTPATLWFIPGKTGNNI